MEWAHPTNQLLMMRARGRVFEPGKEEPGGVGGAEVIWGGGVEGDELGGQVMPRRGPYFFQEDLNQHLLCKFYFHFLK